MECTVSDSDQLEREARIRASLDKISFLMGQLRLGVVTDDKEVQCHLRLVKDKD